MTPLYHRTIMLLLSVLLLAASLWAGEEPETAADRVQEGLTRLIQRQPSGDYLLGEVARLLPAEVLQEKDEALLAVLRAAAGAHAEDAVVAEAYYRLGWLAKGADRRGLMAQCFLTLADYAPHHPKTALALLDVADERIRQQDLAGAREATQRILDGFPGTEAAQTALFVAGCTYEIERDFASVAKTFQQFRVGAGVPASPQQHPRLGEALVKLGHAQVELGQYEEAGETLQAYLKAYPEEESVWQWQPGARPGGGGIDMWHWEAQLNLGRAQARLDRAAEAYQTFRDLARRGGFRGEYREVLQEWVKWGLQVEKGPELLADLNELLKEKPGDPSVAAELYLRRAAVQQALGRADEAKADYDQAAAALAEFAAAHPDDREQLPRVYFDLAGIYEQQQDWDQAQEAYQELIEKFPVDPRARLAMVKLGHACNAAQQYADAAAWFERYVEASRREPAPGIEATPGIEPAAGMAADFDPSVLYSLAWSREMAGDWAGAMEAYRSFVEAVPEAPRTFTEGLHLAKAHLMLNQDEQGLAALTHVAPWARAGRPEEQEESAGLSFQFGQRAEAAQDFDSALAGYRLTVELDPDFPRAAEARLLAGNVHERRREWKEALSYFQAVVDDGTVPAPLRGPARMKAAYCRRELGEVKQAAEELRAVLADYPTDEAIAVPARSALVVCLMKQKAYDEALQVLQEAEGLETPDTALQEYLRFLRPECLAGQGKHAEALELYRQFLQEAQQPALQELAEWGVAQCLEHTGPLEEARAAVENFLEKYPQSSHAPEAKELLKRLSS